MKTRTKRVRRTAGFVLAGIVAVPMLSGCGTHSASTQADQVGLHYKGGPFSSKTYDSFIPASTKQWFGPGDKEYFYPNNKRTYDSTGGPGSERGPITSTSADTAEVATPVSVTFELTHDEVLLRQFHEQIGNRYQAYMTTNDEGHDVTSEGWNTMLQFYFGQALETTLDREIAGYKWRDLYSKPELRVELQDKVNTDVVALVKQQMGAEYFLNVSSLVQKPEPTNPTLKENIAAQQNAVASAQSATAKAQADLATAKAQIALQQAEASKIAADIKPYGSVKEYNIHTCVVTPGCQPYQSTYVVGGSVQPK